MSTIYDIAAWAAVTRLKREELIPEAVDAAKDVYTRWCGAVCFDELKVLAAERTLASGVGSHDISDLEPACAGILSLRLRDANNRVSRLKQSHARMFDVLSPTTTGRPVLYARFGKTLEFNVLTNQTYYLRIRYWRFPTIDVEVGDTEILTPPDWDELYKWETLHMMYTLLEEHEKAMQLMQPAFMPRGYTTRKLLSNEIGIIPRLANDLLKRQMQREGGDSDFSINPIVRRYTAV